MVSAADTKGITMQKLSTVPRVRARGLDVDGNVNIPGKARRPCVRAGVILSVPLEIRKTTALRGLLWRDVMLVRYQRDAPSTRRAEDVAPYHGVKDQWQRIHHGRA